MQERTRTSLLPLICMLAIATPAAAWTYRTPERTALSNIGSTIKGFEVMHRRKPRDWGELDKALGKPLDKVFPTVLPTTRYMYFDPPLTLRLHAHREMKVVALTRKPMLETTMKESWLGRTIHLKGPGRYLLHEGKDGYLIQWLDEPVIGRIWPSSGKALPDPDSEPERAWVREARSSIILRRMFWGGVPAGLLAVVVLRFRRRRHADQRFPPAVSPAG